MTVSMTTSLQSIQRTLRDATEKMLPITGDIQYARREAEQLLEHVMQCDRAWLLAHDQDALSSTQRRMYANLIGRRARHEPLAYLVQRQEFCGLSFFVDKRVLIPRVETQLIVEEAARIVSSSSKSCLLVDIGTGSGTIAISCGHRFPTMPIIATDASPAALQVARKNARALVPSSRITFFQASLIDSVLKHRLMVRSESHLVICANLPYLPRSDKKILSPDVTRYEPSSALFSGEDGLRLIRKFLLQMRRLFVQDGRSMDVLLEFDPPQSAVLLKLACELFAEATVIIKQDECGRDRLLHIQCLVR